MTPAGGEIVALSVERVGVRGDGIADHDGIPIYLPFTAPGDRVRARLGPKRDAGRAGSVVAIEQAGARQAPACPHFGTCGGCALQHLADDAYRATKEDQIRGALAQHGLAGVALDPLRRIPPGTRRRARLTLARSSEGAVVAGFQQRESHRIVDMKVCPMLHPKLVALAAPLRELAPTLLRPGESGAAVLTLVESGVDLLLGVKRRPDLAALEAMAAFAGRYDLARLSWRAGKGAPTLAAERRPARVVFAGVAVDVPPEAFLQASAEAERVLVELVRGGVGPAARVADLYAGFGTFTFALAQNARVHAVDGDRSAIAALAAAAARNALAARVTTELRDLAARPLSSEALTPFDAAVFDPPRAGAAAQARALAQSTVPRVVAVSCNPATFARDARTLVDGGYRLTRVAPVDQFVWSPHVELVAWFER